MLSLKVLKALNDQLNHEDANARLYLQIASWCDAACYRGCAKWFHKSAEDEKSHMMMIAKYISDRNEKFVLAEQPAPPYTFSGLQDIFLKTMDTEKKTTVALSNLYRITLEEKDFVTSTLILPLLKEQVEEENKVQTVLDYIEVAGLTTPGLALIDDKVGGLL